MARQLLERDQELATLVDAARDAADGIGSVVLLHGEAGIGKTSLVSAIRSKLPDGTRMLVGSCDALSTPRTLGPFRDLAPAVGPRLAQALQAGERDEVMDALLDELRQPPPSTVVIEDVHWADEATVDTLRFLVRRIAQLPVVLLLTYRDDELSRDHPLTQLLGDASHAEQVHHLSPQRLTEPAVRELVAGRSLDVDEVYALSDGNPYFVSELVVAAMEMLDAGRGVQGGSSPLANTDASRLVHHASEAGDVDALVRYAPVAARDAATSGAHREAAAHYTLALAHEDRFSAAELADLLEECAVERYTIGAAVDSAAAQRRAVALRRQLQDERGLGLSLRWLSRIMWFNGRPAEAQQAAKEATAVLHNVGDEGLFAFALSNESQLAMLAHRTEEATTLARRAIALATTAGATPVLSHALTNLGLARWQSGDPDGHEDLREAVRVALSINDVEDACRAYVGLVWSLLDEFRLDEAEPLMIKALALAEEAEFMGFLAYLQACQGRLELARGHWEAAVEIAQVASESQPASRCAALTALASVRVRRGEAGATEILEEARRLADQIDELQRIGPVAAARCEHAALQGDSMAVINIAEPVFAEAVRLGDQYLQAELAYWLGKAGRPVAVPDVDHPFALQARGDW